jgi:trk system potassium uptake protein TrkH
MPVFFGCIVLVFADGQSLDIFGAVYASLVEALRYGLFQVVSIITTTGYATADYEQWPAMSQLILLLCMFMGASAGSTGGGMKCLRIMLCFKFCYQGIVPWCIPMRYQPFKIAGKAVPDDVMRSMLGFLALYMGLFGCICGPAGRPGGGF